MRCSSCQEKIPADAYFCIYCGLSTSEAPKRERPRPATGPTIDLSSRRQQPAPVPPAAPVQPVAPAPPVQQVWTQPAGRSHRSGSGFPWLLLLLLMFGLPFILPLGIAIVGMGFKLIGVAFKFIGWPLFLIAGFIIFHKLGSHGRGQISPGMLVAFLIAGLLLVKGMMWPLIILFLIFNSKKRGGGWMGHHHGQHRR